MSMALGTKKELQIYSLVDSLMKLDILFINTSVHAVYKVNGW